MHFFKTGKSSWYYNQEVGTGPTSIYLQKKLNAAGAVSEYKCGENGGALGSCDSLVEVNVDTEDDSVTCVYDKTSAGLSNCCFGTYKYTSKTLNSTGTTISLSISDKDWNGDMNNCIGGAGRTDWAAFSKDGYPLSILEYAGNGIAGTYKVKAPLEVTGDIWNLSAANFYTPAIHTHDGYVSATTSTLPYFIAPIDDRNCTAIPTTGNASYAWDCLGDGYEVKQRLQVYVREWDLYTDYIAYIASSGATSVPDRPGTQEGVDCDGVQPDPCNDRWDLDDFINENLLGPYNTSTPSLRYRNFPNQTF